MPRTACRPLLLLIAAAALLPFRPGHADEPVPMQEGDVTTRPDGASSEPPLTAAVLDSGTGPQELPIPVALIHGTFGAEESMGCLVRPLERAGFRPILVVWQPDRPEQGLDAVLTETLLPVLRAELGGGPWLGVGHSVGALLMRRLIEQPAGPEQEALARNNRGLVLISTPNAGSGLGLARAGCALERGPWRGIICDLRRDSPVLAELSAVFDPSALPPYLTLTASAPGAPLSTLPDLDGDGRRGGSDGVVATDSQVLPGVPRVRIAGPRAVHTEISCRPETAEALLAALTAWRSDRDPDLPEQLKTRGPPLCGLDPKGRCID